jgi:hypothetical protein
MLGTQQVYRYYEGLHRRSPKVQLWSGLAKRAGCPVYAGLSAAEFYGEILGGFSKSVLIHGGHNIFNDLAWQFRAYERSGFYALKHVSDNKLDDGAMQDLELEPWKLITLGEAADDTALINEGTRRLAEREQKYILQPAFNRVIDSIIGGGLDWFYSWHSENPIDPDGVGFSKKYPKGKITNFDDRWRWVENDILPQWQAMDETERNRLVNVPLVDAADPYTIHPVVE